MKESVLDILIYLFENFFDAELEWLPNPTATRSKKSSSRPASPNAKSAAPWSGSRAVCGPGARRGDGTASRSMRVFDAREQVRLDTRLPRLHSAPGEHRHRQRGAARAGDRPAAGARRRQIDIEQVKWVVLMVLFSQPGQENAYLRMEDLVFDGRRKRCTERQSARTTSERRGREPAAATERFHFIYGAENLVIVESPAKAKTIKKYLGKDFEVLASYGHVRDLVPKEGAVDPEAQLRDEVPAHREEREARGRHRAGAEEVRRAVPRDRPGPRGRGDLLAPGRDPEEQDVLDGKDVQRVVFYEITRNAVREAVEQPRGISKDLVNAQQARRALDYLVGFNLSPLLWKKINARPLRGPRAEPGAAADLRARGGDRTLQERASTGRSRPTSRRRSRRFPARLIEYRGEKVEQFTRHERAAGARRARARSTLPRPAAQRSPRRARSSAAAIRRRRSRPRRCSRRRRASSASARSARCGSRSSCTKASTSAKAPSASSPTCAPTR